MLNEIFDKLLEAADSDYQNIYNIAKKYRDKMESDDDWQENKQIFKGECQFYAKDLAAVYTASGYNASAVGGLYLDVSDDFEPDIENYNEDDLEDFRENFDNTWKHWWVVVNNKYIVDVTADQFHPSDEDDYRVIVTDINDSDYKAQVKA